MTVTATNPMAIVDVTREMVVPNPCAQFVMWALMEGSWQGCDIDGAAAQEKAIELGLITEVPYDPAIHGESDYVDIGEAWFVPTETILSQLSVPRHDRASTEIVDDGQST